MTMQVLRWLYFLCVVGCGVSNFVLIVLFTFLLWLFGVITGGCVFSRFVFD